MPGPITPKLKNSSNTEQILPPGQVKPTLVTIKLNMLELAQAGGIQEASKKIQEDLLALVEEQGSQNGWLWHLSQAEQTDNPVRQRVFLKKSFDTLMALTSSSTNKKYTPRSPFSRMTDCPHSMWTVYWKRANTTNPLLLPSN